MCPRSAAACCRHGFLEAHPDMRCPYASAPLDSDDDDNGSESGCGADSDRDADDDAQPKPSGVTRAASTPLSQLPGGAVMAVHAYPLTLSRLIAQWVEGQGGFGAFELVPSPVGTVHKQLQVRPCMHGSQMIDVYCIACCFMHGCWSCEHAVSQLLCCIPGVATPDQ